MALTMHPSLSKLHSFLFFLKNENENKKRKRTYDFKYGT